VTENFLEHMEVLALGNGLEEMLCKIDVNNNI
jgi:hypothetical protein